MYRIGEAEVKRIQKLFDSGNIFRYGSGGECDRFEKNWARYVGADYCRMARSGTSALYTALVGLGVGHNHDGSSRHHGSGPLPTTSDAGYPGRHQWPHPISPLQPTQSH